MTKLKHYNAYHLSTVMFKKWDYKNVTLLQKLFVVQVFSESYLLEFIDSHQVLLLPALRNQYVIAIVKANPAEFQELRKPKLILLVMVLDKVEIKALCGQRPYLICTKTVGSSKFKFIFNLIHFILHSSGSTISLEHSNYYMVSLCWI